MGASNLVTKVYIPREILPTAAALTKVVDLAFGLLILASLMVYFGHPPEWTVVWVPILFFIHSPLSPSWWATICSSAWSPALQTESEASGIEFWRVSKRFQLHEGRTLREFVPAVLRGRDTSEPFYALRDVTFSIRRGETVGIIGHNGSGKSTILKLIASCGTSLTRR